MDNLITHIGDVLGGNDDKTCSHNTKKNIQSSNEPNFFEKEYKKLLTLKFNEIKVNPNEPFLYTYSNGLPDKLMVFYMAFFPYCKLPTRVKDEIKYCTIHECDYTVTHIREEVCESLLSLANEQYQERKSYIVACIAQNKLFDDKKINRIRIHGECLECRNIRHSIEANKQNTIIPKKTLI
jgi:hypothetical protein